MFQIRPNYRKLKTALQLVKTRLKILQAKNSEQREKKKAELVSYLKNGKFPQAGVSAHTAIRHEANSDAMSLIGMFCDQLLERYILFKEMKSPESSILIPVSNLIWIAPYFGNHVKELNVIFKQLAVKYGKKFCKKTSKNKYGHVSDDLIKNVERINPSKETIENYLKLICSENNIIYNEKKTGNSPDNQRGCNVTSDKFNEEIHKDNQTRYQTECINAVDTSIRKEISGENEDEVARNASRTSVVSNTDVKESSSRSQTECINKIDTSIRKEKSGGNEDEVARNASRTSVASNTDVKESSSSKNALEKDQENSPQDKLHESRDRPEVPLNRELEEMEEKASAAKTDEYDYNPSSVPQSSNLYNNSYYLDPPPSYSQCMNDSKEAYTKRETFDYIYQHPTCPTENCLNPPISEDIVKDTETKPFDT